LKKEIVIHPAPLNLKNPSSLSDSKLVVEQQLMHFLELVYLEN
jgi:hypothetical protein